MKTAILASPFRSGGRLYAIKLSHAVGASLLSAGTSIVSLYLAIVKEKIDVVDIQLEYRAFGSHLKTLLRLPMVAFVIRRRSKVFITVHGILTPEALQGQHMRWLKWLSFVCSLRLSAASCNGLIVHSEEMRLELARLGFVRVRLIPHGSGPLIARESDRSRTGVLFFGFIRPSKGIEALLSAFKELAKEFPNSKLMIAGGADDAKDPAYLNVISALIRDFELQGRVTLTPRFLSDDEKLKLAKDAAVLVLPYRDKFLEVSGVLHDFAGLGVAVVCSDSPRFSELVNGSDCLKVSTQSQLTEAIRLLLRDEKKRELLARNLSRLAVQESWNAVAAKRLELFASTSGSSSRGIRRTQGEE